MLLSVVFVGSCAHASAPRLKVFRCAQALLSVRDRHESAEQSARETSRALDELHRFRAWALANYDFTPGPSARTTTDASWPVRKNALARRLSAILAEGRAAAGEGSTGVAERQITRAAVFEGDEEIAEVLAVLARAASVNSEVEHSLKSANGVNFVLGPLLTSLLSLPILTVAAGLEDVGAWTIFGALGVVVRFEPESTLRGWGGYDVGRSIDDHVRDRLVDLKPGVWWTTTSDFTMPREILGRLWLTRAVSAQNVALYALWKRYPRWSAKLTSPKFSVLQMTSRFTSRVNELPQAHLRTDLVLSRSKAGVPRLIIVTRVSDTLPNYPVAAGAKARPEALGLPSLNPSN